MNQALTIADGFGRRLRAERERLGFSQSALAEVAGVRRLAQSQYEKETSSPNIRYLAAIGGVGLNLDYILFGRSVSEREPTPEELYRVEGDAFRMLEEFLKKQPAGDMGAEGRFALFQVFRGNLMTSLGYGASALN